MLSADIATHTLGFTADVGVDVRQRFVHFAVDLNKIRANGGVLIYLPFHMLDHTGDQSAGVEEDKDTTGKL